MNKSLITITTAMVLLGSVVAASAKAEKTFLNDAIQDNLAEISVGQLAQKNGASDAVRAYGQTLVQDHSAANEEAMSLAKSMGVTPPTEPKPEAKQEYDKLSKLSGEAFDREFAKHMVSDHQKAIKEFEDQSGGTDEVAAFAKKTLPTLQKHLKTAQSLASGKSVQE
jgi:putative membrane protein